MYKVAIILGLWLALAHALPQNAVRLAGPVNSDIDIDIDIDLSGLVIRLAALVDAIRNIDLSGIIDLGIDIDIGIDLQALADFLEAILTQYHAGNKAALLCLIRVAEEYDVTETANAYIDYLLSFIDLVNSVAEEVGRCNPGGVLPNPITIAICLANVTVNYGVRITAATINLIARWAVLAQVVPSVLRCVAEAT